MHIDVVFLTKLMDILIRAIAAPFADDFSKCTCWMGNEDAGYNFFRFGFGLSGHNYSFLSL